MKTIIIILAVLIAQPVPSQEITSMEQTGVSYPENIEHCERNFYLAPEERTFDDQCDPITTLHYIINK